mmetsp:Transcript_30349/g.92821  ORF Transcript_30349/g.92821 Transcript_30349/m.92821 type:complete len:463 (+) Transcript_30349:359-1747(+)
MSMARWSRLRLLAKHSKNLGETNLQPETATRARTWKLEEASAWMASSFKFTHLLTWMSRQDGAKIVSFSSLFMFVKVRCATRLPSTSTCLVRQLSITTRSRASWPTERTSPKALAFLRRRNRTAGHTAKSLARAVAKNLGASTTRRSSKTARASPSTWTCFKPTPPTSRTRSFGACATVEATVVPVSVSSLTSFAGTRRSVSRLGGSFKRFGALGWSPKFETSSFRSAGSDWNASFRIPAKAAVAVASSSSSSTISRVRGPNRSHRSGGELRDGAHAIAVSTRTTCSSSTRCSSDFEDSPAAAASSSSSDGRAAVRAVPVVQRDRSRSLRSWVGASSSTKRTKTSLSLTRSWFRRHISSRATGRRTLALARLSRVRCASRSWRASTASRLASSTAALKTSWKAGSYSLHLVSKSLEWRRLWAVLSKRPRKAPAPLPPAPSTTGETTTSDVSFWTSASTSDLE